MARHCLPYTPARSLLSSIDLTKLESHFLSKGTQWAERIHISSPSLTSIPLFIANPGKYFLIETIFFTPSSLAISTDESSLMLST